MHCFGVPILGVLNQKYHEEGDNGRGGVYDQLPRVGKMKSGASEEPDGNHKHSSGKCPGAAENHGGMARENASLTRQKKSRSSSSFFSFSIWFLFKATLAFASESRIARTKHAGRSPVQR